MATEEVKTEVKTEEISEKTLALRWNMSAGTLRWWRAVAKGPPYNKRGRKVTYSLTDIVAYELENKVIPGAKKKLK